MITLFLAGRLRNFSHQRHVHVANILWHLPQGWELMHLGLQVMAYRNFVPDKHSPEITDREWAKLDGTLPDPAVFADVPGGAAGMNDRHREAWGQVWVLSLTETVSWGILYYAFVALLIPMRDDLGWSEGQLTAAYSFGILISGLTAPIVGMVIDRQSARILMPLVSLGATCLVLAWARVETFPIYVLIWVGIGVMMSWTLYEPAFATITRWFAHDRSRPLLVVTICAGFASTIFLPLTTWLAMRYGWRQTLDSYAAMLLLLTALPHVFLLRRPPPLPHATPEHGERPKEGMRLRDATRLRAFWQITGAFGLQAFASTAVAAFLIAYLVEQGDSPAFAATATGAIGAAQVLARILMTLFGKRWSPVTLAAIMLGMQALAVGILVLWTTRPGVMLAVLLLGAGRGALTLLRPMILLDRFGLHAFASISGTQSAAVSICGALAPVAMGMAYGIVGAYRPLMIFMGALGLVAALTMLHEPALAAHDSR
jgi:predicted MFS family arabinose efflux permease